ncbi:class I SAM-dependent methyltransferase [Paenibacillus pinihumi]|uniref:class I SAM-dependent methyltransferase n=1 Tax=Paenibacillus pinihumi TaxID=669462 RepID=UPI0004005209|nr:class I SAM-dependent methyltransferase [Paenibacillus pinihumi]
MNSKERFSNRVDTYVKYRPSYPVEAVDYLYTVVGLGADSKVADIGAGTGIFSERLLERGSRVTAVEPNQAMREAALEKLGGQERFHAVAGSAEVTGLPDHSADFIVCAQSFHWFDRSAAQTEFRRVLHPGGKAVLIWNTRLTQGTPFRGAYDRLIHTFGMEYKNMAERKISSADLSPFFKPGSMQEARFTIQQAFDYEGLSGRLLSSSFIPEPGHPGYEPMIQELKTLFDRYEQDGQVTIDYETEVYWGEV